MRTLRLETILAVTLSTFTGFTVASCTDAGITTDAGSTATDSGNATTDSGSTTTDSGSNDAGPAATCTDAKKNGGICK